MTTYTVAATNIVLYDMWPGVALTGWKPTADSNGNIFTNSTHHNVETAQFKPGTKVCVYDATSKGWSTFIYLQYNSGGVTLACGHVAVLESGNSWYGVTNEGDSCLVNVPPAVALSAVTDTYYGWFWGGGVCPQTLVTDLADASVYTDGNVAIGPIGLVDCTDPDQVGFTVAASAVNAVGFSLAADA